LASLPQKFRKTIWLKRKDFVICQPIQEGNKVKYEITRILQNHHLKELKLEKKFAKEFGGGDNIGLTTEPEAELKPEINNLDQSADSDDSNDSIPSNVNRRFVEIEESSESESESSDESEYENEI
jgi:probable RNA-binding protein EIF1AD